MNDPSFTTSPYRMDNKESQQKKSEAVKKIADVTTLKDRGNLLLKNKDTLGAIEK